MTLRFTFLAPALHPVAERVGSHFRNDQGVTRLRPEVEVDPEVHYQPTLVGVGEDGYTVCVDVTDGPFTGSLESVVLACGSRNLPVKLYLAIPEGVSDTVFRDTHGKCQEHHVGLIVVGARCRVVENSMPMTFLGFRRPDKSKFPRKYRQALADAENLIETGDPAKGCSLVYDELEALTRRIAEWVLDNGYVDLTTPIPKMDLEAGPWAKVIELVDRHADFAQLKTTAPSLDHALLSRLAGIVPYRNATGHKPANRRERMIRDAQLRTRFEHAVDTLLDVSQAVRRQRL